MYFHTPFLLPQHPQTSLCNWVLNHIPTQHTVYRLFFFLGKCFLFMQQTIIAMVTKYTSLLSTSFHSDDFFPLLNRHHETLLWKRRERRRGANVRARARDNFPAGEEVVKIQSSNSLLIASFSTDLRRSRCVFLFCF